jgi:hypothetical protein
MTWSAEQCRLLDALGYERLEPGRPPPATRESGAAATAGPSASRSSPPPAPRPAPAFPHRAGPPAVAPAASTARLLEALRRAANGADPMPLVDDLDRLRRDPALKRALWPRLRALRRSH